MASLTAKVIHGKTYYYARECQRVQGKPKIVRTVYLGSADDLIAAATKQTLVIYPKRQGQRHPSTARARSTLSPEQEQIVRLLDLRRHL